MKNINSKRGSGHHNGAQAQGNSRNLPPQSDFRQDRNGYNVNRSANQTVQGAPPLTQVNMQPNAVATQIPNLPNIAVPQQSNVRFPSGQNPSNLIQTHLIQPGQTPVPLQMGVRPQLMGSQGFRAVYSGQPPRVSFTSAQAGVYNSSQRSQVPTTTPILPQNPAMHPNHYTNYFPIPTAQAFYPSFHPHTQAQFFAGTIPFPEMSQMRPPTYTTQTIQSPQSQASQPPYRPRERKVLTVYNLDGTIYDLEKIKASVNEDKSTHPDSSGNKESESKPLQNEANGAQAPIVVPPTTRTPELNSVEDVIDADTTSADASTQDASVTLGQVETKCDKTEAAETDKENDMVVIADQLNNTHLNEEKEEIFVDNVPVSAVEVTTANVELETDDKSSKQTVEHPKPEMTPSDQNEKPILEPQEPEDQVKSSDMSSTDSSVGTADAKLRPRVYNRQELLDMMSLAEAHPLPDNFFPEFSKKQSPAEALLPKYANRSGSGNEYRRTPMNSGRRNPQSNKFPERNRKSSNVPMSGDNATNIYTPSVDAWKPDSLTGSSAAANSEEAATEKLLKNVRSILNKLTPQNYEDLLKQFRVLDIQTKEQLKRVIDRIFEKAVIEPAFVVQYAGFCSELVSIAVNDPEKKEGKVSFKNLLIKKCEETFNERMYSDIENYEERIQEIENCKDPVKKKELEEIFDDDKRYSRKRSVGNIKLIAELYKINMLNTKIMCGCFTKLLQTNHEDYIECLCTLITNIGSTFTTQLKVDRNSGSNSKHFNYVFEQLNLIYEDKHERISVSSRIRFMILDLIDLRNNGWIPRRKADGPKKLAQVHQDLEIEERRRRAEMDEMRKNKRLSTISGPPATDGGGWQVPKKKNNPSIKVPLSFSNISSNRGGLKAGEGFKSFASGSHGGVNSNSQSRSSSSNFENQNKFSQLSDTKAYHESMNSKPERRDERKTSDVTGYQTRSDSGTYTERHDNSNQNGLTEEELAEKCRIIIKKFISNGEEYDETDLSDTMKSLKEICPPNSFRVFVKTIMTCAAAAREKERTHVGKLFGYILQNFNYTNTEIDSGLKQYFDTEFDDDFPYFWKFAGFTLGYALCEIKDNRFKQNEIFKHIGDTLSNVTGSNSVKLSDALLSKIRELKCEDKLKDILHKSSIINNVDSVGNNKAKQLVHSYFNKKGSDPKELLSQFESENCDDKKYEALCAEIVYYLHDNLSVLDKSKDEVIRLIQVLPKDSFINQIFKVDVKMNHPQDLLQNLLNFCLQSKLITEADILHSSKACSVLQKVVLERLTRQPK